MRLPLKQCRGLPMVERWAGIVASGQSVIVVGAEIPDDPDDPIVITYDQTWSVQ
jgi:hypothetical protein